MQAYPCFQEDILDKFVCTYSSFFLKHIGDQYPGCVEKFSAKTKWNGRKVKHRLSLPSHLSFSNFREIQQIRFVSKSWNKFLSEDRILMLKIVRKAEPYLEDLCSKLSDESRPVTRKEQNEKISLYKSDDYFCCDKYFNPDDQACGFDCGYGCK